MSNNHSASQEAPPPLYVSGISISLAKDSGKTIGHVELRAKDDVPLKDFKTIHAGDTHLEKFDPPLLLDLDDHIIVSAKCGSRFRKQPDVAIDINLRDVTCLREEQGIRSYRKKERKVEIVVTGGCNHQPPLLATTTEITDSCSQFRLLIIGNSGVGKSSLIRKVFGVAEVDVSGNTRGSANIDREFISRTNERFVVHDSLGFEAADKKNMDLVKEFVAKRKNMPQLKDQLHAVWLCLEIPYSGGRLLEAGVERFLQLRHDILGNVPLVVVLTKIDLLDTQLELDMPPTETPGDYRSRHMKKHLINPLCKAAGEDVTYVTISTEDGYSESLSDLVKATDDIMQKQHVNEATRVAAIIAQRVSIKPKIEASIAIGKKKYWKMLLKSAVFRGHTLKECLKVIHKDIITVWNFCDPDLCLTDDKITTMLLRTDYLAGDTPDADAPSDFTFGTLLASGFELVKNVASGDPLASLASAATVSYSIVKIMNEIFKEAKRDVKILMGYIVDLICVMQAIYLLPSSYPLTEETIVLVLRAYEKTRKFVHQTVDAFDGKLGVRPGGCDHVLDKIEELIWLYSIPDHEVEILRRNIRKILSSGSA